MRFFTSDHHWCHPNIIKHSNRPFKDVDEMNEVMVARWNEVVKPQDTVYHLGDVVVGNPKKARPYLDRLNGTIHLVHGNHDPGNAMKPACRDRFETIQPYLELKFQDPDAPRGKRHIMLFHYSMRSWNSRYHNTWHLFGHSHGNLPPHGKSFDVSVDCHNFYPLSYDQVKAKMATLDVGKFDFQVRGEM
jgi:calcineurin-like phosphoesterase family protein